MFTSNEKQLLIDAIEMAIKSNKRQETAKPQYSIITKQIDTDLTNLLIKLKNITPDKK